MSAVVEAKVLDRGVWVTDQKKPAEPGQVFLMDSLEVRSFKVDGKSPRLVLQGLDNEVNVECWDETASDTFYPQTAQILYNWEFRFGKNPNRPVQHIFGQPGMLSAEFLGHPNRDVLGPLMQAQETKYDPGVVIPNYEFAEWKSFIMLTSPVFKTNLYGLDSHKLNHEKDDPRHGFTGKAMIVGEVGYYARSLKPEPQIKLGIATVAQSDGLLRVYEARDWYTLPKDYYDSAIYRLAKVSLFSRTLASEEPHYPWLKEGFPLEALTGFYEFIEDAGRATRGNKQDFPDSWGRELDRRYNFNFLKMIKDLPQQDILIEAQRINGALGRVMGNKVK